MRRFRFGFKATLFGDIALHSEADLGLENQVDLSTMILTDTYISWSTENGMKFKLGKQSAPFTLDGSTSSKKLHTLERSKIAGNIWFGQEYFPRISVSGSKTKSTILPGFIPMTTNLNLMSIQARTVRNPICWKRLCGKLHLEKSYLRLDFMFQRR